MTEAVPEFSFPVEVLSLPPSGRVYTITADAEARGRVAERLGLQSIDKLTAQLEVMPEGAGVAVSGHMDADIVQRCVVSLAPVPAHIHEEIDVKFAAPVSPSKQRDAEEDDEFEEDVEPPEMLQDGRIDLGELTVSQMVLGLDPYPRAPGATFEAVKWGVGDEKASPANPFAALAKLKRPRPK